MRFLFLLFVCMPIAEIYLLIQVGGRIGALNTVFLLFITALAGVALLQQQGLDTLFKANQKLQRGEIPIREVLSGVMLAFGGALLLTPGFITDAVGFFCLLPWTRYWCVQRLIDRGVVNSQGFQYSSNAFYQQQTTSRSHQTRVDRDKSTHTTTIEGECHRDD